MFSRVSSRRNNFRASKTYTIKSGGGIIQENVSKSIITIESAMYHNFWLQFLITRNRFPSVYTTIYLRHKLLALSLYNSFLHHFENMSLWNMIQDFLHQKKIRFVLEWAMLWWKNQQSKYNQINRNNNQFGESLQEKCSNY